MAQNTTTVFLERINIHGVLSDQTCRVLLIVFNVFMGYPVALFGIAGNIINVIVYLRQGIGESINISFLGLAITDLGTIVTYFWCCLCLNPWFQESDTPIIFSEVWYLTAAYPTVVFFRISCWITVFIALERCLCIVKPLEVKQIVIPYRTAGLIVFFYLTAALFYIVPAQFTTYLAWRFDVNRNKTVLGIAFTAYHDVKTFDYYKDIVLLFISFFSLNIVTFVLVIQIRKISKWRQSVSAVTGHKDSMSISQKDKKIVRIACLISLIFIVSFLPDVLLQIVYLINPEFAITRREENLVFVCWSFAFLCHALSAGANVLVYYNMSSKYRMEFQSMFRSCFGQVSTTNDSGDGNASGQPD